MFVLPVGGTCVPSSPWQRAQGQPAPHAVVVPGLARHHVPAEVAAVDVQIRVDLSFADELDEVDEVARAEPRRQVSVIGGIGEPVVEVLGRQCAAVDAREAGAVAASAVGAVTPL